MEGHTLRAPLAATSFAHWYLLGPSDDMTSCVKRCHCPPPAATTANYSSCCSFPRCVLLPGFTGFPWVAGRWLLVAICCLPKRMVAMAPLQIFEASILFRVSVSQITRRFASGVVRLWVTTIAEILQKIYILEGIAQKKG